MEQLRAVRDSRVQERQQVLKRLAGEAQVEGRVKEGERGCHDVEVNAGTCASLFLTGRRCGEPAGMLARCSGGSTC